MLPKVVVATNSLGKSAAGHTIHRKLEAAARHGFDGCEVAFECLDAHASTSFSAVSDRGDRLRAAAADIYKKASSLNLSLIALNPFGAYDGLIHASDVEERLKEAELWCQLCAIMHIPIFQICTALYGIDITKITSSANVIASNMRKLASLASKYNLQVAYEAPAWGIHNSTWQSIQAILDLLPDVPNIGHCMDTFHVSARVAGDPFNSSSPVLPDGMEKLTKSLAEMKTRLDPNKIAYFQLSDATVADIEQKGYPKKDLGQPGYMTQSRNCRIYPCEEGFGGVLPAVEVARAVFGLGYRGWVSMEVFHVDMWEERESVPDDWARRGMESWREVVRRCGLERGGKL